MYSENYMNTQEMSNFSDSIAARPDHTYDPVAVIERAEENIMRKILVGACSKDERGLISALGGLLDESWHLPTGKALRGELRAMFTKRGRSERRFYAAFHALERRYHAL